MRNRRQSAVARADRFPRLATVFRTYAINAPAPVAVTVKAALNGCGGILRDGDAFQPQALRRASEAAFPTLLCYWRVRTIVLPRVPSYADNQTPFCDRLWASMDLQMHLAA